MTPRVKGAARLRPCKYKGGPFSSRIGLYLCRATAWRQARALQNRQNTDRDSHLGRATGGVLGEPLDELLEAALTRFRGARLLEQFEHDAAGGRRGPLECGRGGRAKLQRAL